MRAVKVDSLKASVYWTFRSWMHGFPIKQDMSSWTAPYPLSDEYRDELRGNASRWGFLSPFFKSHGYYLYDYNDRVGFVHSPAYPEPRARDESVRDPYPYPYRLWEQPHDLVFTAIETFRMWAARDESGREVIIRMISGPTSSDELKIFQRLNSTKARADPRNHTLPVLEYLTFDGFVFVVMPRWGDSFTCDVDQLPFSAVSEIFDLAETLFEGLEFLHENCIAHRDITHGNTVMNVIEPMVFSGRSDMRKPGDVRYAYIDWDAAIIFPEGTDIRSVQVTREIRTTTISAGLVEGLSNPFKDDVRFLTKALARYLRVTENEIPSIGIFFEDVLSRDDRNLPSAKECLTKLRDIRASTSKSILQSRPLYLHWHRGVALNVTCDRNTDQNPPGKMTGFHYPKSPST
ncbi:other/AgaK1 protein kinase [Ephemerocybe angulata]|uniref:Other/AgaK1 protein kinase n=1 Tax=Ephemerocybe angulata TaxID=980116 RepID=A0A8H6HU70_9AGAR|nr:other/AgaK1 protein kinase [Tulosesus angulatus]